MTRNVHSPVGGEGVVVVPDGGSAGTAEPAAVVTDHPVPGGQHAGHQPRGIPRRLLRPVPVKPASPAEAVKGAGILITMLADGPATAMHPAAGLPG